VLDFLKNRSAYVATIRALSQSNDERSGIGLGLRMWAEYSYDRTYGQFGQFDARQYKNYYVQFGCATCVMSLTFLCTIKSKKCIKMLIKCHIGLPSKELMPQ